jgi:hypothetical protein
MSFLGAPLALPRTIAEVAEARALVVSRSSCDSATSPYGNALSA